MVIDELPYTKNKYIQITQEVIAHVHYWPIKETMLLDFDDLTEGASSLITFETTHLESTMLPTKIMDLKFTRIEGGVLTDQERIEELEDNFLRIKKELEDKFLRIKNNLEGLETDVKQLRKKTCQQDALLCVSDILDYILKATVDAALDYLRYDIQQPLTMEDCRREKFATVNNLWWDANKLDLRRLNQVLTAFKNASRNKLAHIDVDVAYNVPPELLKRVINGGEMDVAEMKIFINAISRPIVLPVSEIVYIEELIDLFYLDVVKPGSRADQTYNKLVDGFCGYLKSKN
ncbi:hypothetical protein AKO1_000652, partial [Acrasis kona]